MFNLFVFSLLCVSAFADTITPYHDCAESFIYYSHTGGVTYHSRQYRQWNDCDFYVFSFGYEISDGVNRSFVDHLRSDLETHRCFGKFVISYEDDDCEQWSAEIMDHTFEYNKGPVDTGCPDGSSTCKKYENGSKYIILDSRGRFVASDENITITYLDDLPTLDMFGFTGCDGVEVPAPTIDLCSPASSYGSSSSLIPSGSQSSSASVATVAISVAAVATFITALL